MVVPNATLQLLSSLMDSLKSANSTISLSDETFLPPPNGISLLDVKNDLLLSYLQNLILLIVTKLRNNGDEKNVKAEVTQKLVQLRVYLDKGIRPLEGRLKYQIDKAIRVAEDADRASAQREKHVSLKPLAQKAKSKNGIRSDDSGDESDASGSEPQAADDESPIFRGNISLIQQKVKLSDNSAKSRLSSNAPYKPPRITPTAMPAPPSSRDQPRKRRSHLIDEYVDTELSSTPMAQPSIGSNSTILDRGRGGLSARDRAKEKERTEYEERNLIRLPGESKAERRKARLRGEGGGRRDIFGGEDWTGLGGLGDRVSRSLSGAGRDKSSVLQRREKRRATEDGPRGDGVGMGETFEKRRKTLQGRADRKTKR